jgi:hypothetical protein
VTNTLLTSTEVTREALRILHQKLNFVGNIDLQYDDSFAQKGAKIGDTLKIREPNQYVVRTGAALAAQDTTEKTLDLTVSTQKGVDLNFTSADLSMSMDDFSKRIIDPAVSVLAANIEADALSMIKGVYNTVFNVGSAATYRTVMQSRKRLVDSLTPMDNQVCALLNTTDNVDLVDAMKGLFQDSTAIKEQYREGMLGRTGGFNFYENTMMPTLTTGTAVSGDTGYNVNTGISGATGLAGVSTLGVSGASTTFTEGDIIQISGVNAVHPETKADLGVLQNFVVTADYSGGAGSISIAPTIYTSGGRQNVSQDVILGNAILKPTFGASQTTTPSIFFHKEAFAFATADLIMPEDVHFGARENFEGISMRILRQYDISDDTLPCRLDVMYGYTPTRRGFASRLHSN